MVMCRSKNGHQKGIMCLQEIGLRAQYLLTILCSIVNMIGGTFVATSYGSLSVDFDNS